jgi:UDP:flavonoid glycosyltransferase YjiC (YdhE family)
MRVLMTCQPAFSHAIQLIPLARKLTGDGHPVVVATSASFASVLSRHGIDARAFDPDWMIGPGDPVYDRTVGRHLFPGFAQVPSRSSVNRVLDLARDWQADLIVRDYSEFTGWIVARKLSIPLVTHGIMHRLRPSTEDGVAQAAGRLAELAGVDPPRDRDDLLGRAYLDIVPPSYRWPWEHDQPLAQLTRPSSFDGPPQPGALGWLDALGRTRPLVYVSLGNVFSQPSSLWQVILAALTELDVDAVVTTGGTDPENLGPPPANVRVERYVPQSHVLPRCTAVVCHAGFSTLIGALAHGLPAVCLPLAADHPVNAQRCAEAGAGLNCANAPALDPRGPLVDPATLRPGDVASAISRLLGDPAFTSAAARIAREIRDMPGTGETARLLQQAVGAPRPGDVDPEREGSVRALPPQPGAARR